MDFITSGAFLGVSALIVAVFLITLMRRISYFFLLTATVGTVILAGIVIVTIVALSGADRFALEFSNPPV